VRVSVDAGLECSFVKSGVVEELVSLGPAKTALITSCGRPRAGARCHAADTPPESGAARYFTVNVIELEEFETL